MRLDLVSERQTLSCEQKGAARSDTRSTVGSGPPLRGAGRADRGPGNARGGANEELELCQRGSRSSEAARRGAPDPRRRWPVGGEHV